MPTTEFYTAERVQSRFIEPMLADAVRELPDGGLWTYEAKLREGFTGRCYLSGISSLKNQNGARCRSNYNVHSVYSVDRG